MSILQNDSTAGQPEIIPPGGDDYGRDDPEVSDDNPAPDERDLFEMPSEADELWNCENSPLRNSMYFVEGEPDPTDPIYRTVSPAEHYEPGPEDWEEYEIAFARIDAKMREFRSAEFYP